MWDSNPRYTVVSGLRAYETGEIPTSPTRDIVGPDGLEPLLKRSNLQSDCYIQIAFRSQVLWNG